MLPSCGNKRHFYPVVPSEPSQSTQAVLRTVIYSYNVCFLEVDLGARVGEQENQKPATQICQRLRNKAQLSERGTHLGDPRVHQRAADARAPFSAFTPPFALAPLSALLPLLLPRLPSPAKYGNPPELGGRGSRQPAPSQGSARSARVPPPVRPQSLSPSSGKLSLELPGKARAEGAGSRRPGQGFLPLPPPAPQQQLSGLKSLPLGAKA
ncbi:translation initiation factor IF-2-like isoform X2 [Rousettus aegyptiacus]|uniref:translation initiation factor IF-2-like isoform X2 n=1 Tax=Rousettus aegyptiacus TaxID=9407 RepID=UPI00168D2841|nr:translation initiation factor IF-2-like isoform X2 [Rousettus aegyptiacus]